MFIYQSNSRGKKLTPLRLFLAKIWEVVFGDIEPGAELKFLKTARRKKSVQIQNSKWDTIPTPTNYYTRLTCRCANGCRIDTNVISR